MDPATQQFFAAQMNSKPHCHSAEFASPAESATTTGTKGQTQGVHEPSPPTYSHSTDPLDADDWWKTITKKLERAQRNDREMVLYASERLEA
jgi:hypothetical protein